MKLGSKSKDVDSFVDQLRSEGQVVAEVKKNGTKICAMDALCNCACSMCMQHVCIAMDCVLGVCFVYVS